MAGPLQSLQFGLDPALRTRLEMGQSFEDAGGIVTVQSEKITLCQVEGIQGTLLSGQCQRFFAHFLLGIAYQHGGDAACEYWQVVATVAGEHCVSRTDSL